MAERQVTGTNLNFIMVLCASLWRKIDKLGRKTEMIGERR